MICLHFQKDVGFNNLFFKFTYDQLNLFLILIKAITLIFFKSMVLIFYFNFHIIAKFLHYYQIPSKLFMHLHIFQIQAYQILLL